jgi:hypothetical protein
MAVKSYSFYVGTSCYVPRIEGAECAEMWDFRDVSSRCTKQALSRQ